MGWRDDAAARVFTYWEPEESMPYYLQLCMQTWKRFLPDTSIVILNNKNLGDYIDLSAYGSNLLDGRFSLPQISDAIRVMLLEKYGGLWLNVDTILLNSSVSKYFELHDKNEAVFFGSDTKRTVNIAAIASRPSARVMRLWLKYITERVQNFDASQKNLWSYLGNSFINPYAKDFSFADEIRILDRSEVMPELELLRTHVRQFTHVVKYKTLSMRLRLREKFAIRQG